MMHQILINLKNNHLVTMFYVHHNMHSPLMNAYKKMFQKSNMGVHLELGHILRTIIFLFVSWPPIFRIIQMAFSLIF
jgi:hypothetical protein